MSEEVEMIIIEQREVEKVRAPKVEESIISAKEALHYAKELQKFWEVNMKGRPNQFLALQDICSCIENEVSH